MKAPPAAPADIFELHANFCRTLANATRLKILALLGRKATTVGEIADAIGVPVPNISQHLAILKSQHLVAARKQGHSVYYSLVDRRIVQACAQIRSVLLDQMQARGEFAREADPRQEGGGSK